MSLKRLNRIFGTRQKLSRKDIDTYGSTSDEAVKHDIESRSTEGFEADAAEGWADLNYDTSIMKSMDKKFIGSSNTGLIIGSAVGIIAVGTIAFFLLRDAGTEIKGEDKLALTEDKVTELMENQEITMEETDLVLPEPIQDMNAAPKKDQIQAKAIVEDHEKMKKQDEEEFVEVELLPILDVVPEANVPEIIRDHKHAKEIYLHDLKLVDYRKYRSKPEIQTTQIVLSGTTADRENKESTGLESTIKDVSIPYIEYVDKSMSKFSKGRYKQSLVRFEVILESYADDVNANFYAGICLFNLEEYEAAIEHFARCINGPFSNFDEEAQWMTALSYEKLGKTAKAQQYYKKIVEQGGFYKKQAVAKMN